MLRFLYILIIIFFTSTSCSTVKKQSLKKKTEKKLEKTGTSEDTSIYTFYVDAEEIIQKNLKSKFDDARKKILYIITHINPKKDVFNLEDAYYLLGLLNIKERRYDEAIEAFNIAIEKDPGNIKSFNGAGLAYTHLRKFDKGEENFKKILTLDKFNYAAYMNLGFISHKKGDYEKALTLFNKAASIKKNDYRAYFNIAESYYNMEKYNLAKKYYIKSIKADNDAALKAKNNLSYLLLKKKKYTEAMRLLETNKNPIVPSPNFYINLAVAQRNVGKLEEAEKNYQRALELNPKSTVALINLGILYDIYFGKRTLALSYYKKYIDLDGKKKKSVKKWISVIKGSGAKREQ